MAKASKPVPHYILGGQATAKLHARMHAAIRERVVKLRDAGLTYEEIGKILGKTRQWAHSIYRRSRAA